GMRTALNLPDLSVAGKTAHAGGGEGVSRGEVVTLKELGNPGNTFDVLLKKSARLAGSKNKAARPLKEGTLVRVHHGSGNSAARIYLLDGKELGPGQQGVAQLRLESPVFAFTGDCFIVRDWAEQATF